MVIIGAAAMMRGWRAPRQFIEASPDTGKAWMVIMTGSLASLIAEHPRPRIGRDRTAMIVLHVSAPPGKRAPKAKAAHAPPRAKAVARTTAAAKAPAKKAVLVKKT